MEYELCVLFGGNKTEEENNELAKSVDNLLKDAQAEVKFTHSLGRKKLAYAIENQTHADYRIWLFKAEADAIENLNEKLRLDQEVLRHLIVKLEKISIDEKIMALQEPKKDLEPEEVKQEKSVQEDKPVKTGRSEVTFVDEPEPDAKQDEKPAKESEEAKKEENKVSLDQLDEKLDELLESDKL